MDMGRWDALPEAERSLWLARQHRRDRRHRCGRPQEVCSDPGREWFPQLSVCYPTREEQAAQARFERLHEKAPWHDGTFESWRAKPDEAHPYHFLHGTTVWVAETDLGMGGDFLSSGSALEAVEEPEAGDG